MATYYIDFVDGDDTAAGTSTATAWKTIPGTRNTADTADQSTDWGSGTINVSNKTPAGTIFKITGGTTHDSTNGGLIIINGGSGAYYQDGTMANPIVFEPDTAWQAGPVTFDFTGVTVGIAGIQIRKHWVTFDGLVNGGFVIRDSTLGGIQVKEFRGTSAAIINTVLHHIDFIHNGTSYTTSSEGSGDGQLKVRRCTDIDVANCTFDGDKASGDGWINGCSMGESGWEATGTITDCIAFDHQGNDPPNDSGIGFKALNGQLTWTNCVSHDNLKGFDCGEISLASTADITYTTINCTAYNNKFGISNNGPDAAWTGTITFTLINNYVYDNTFLGGNFYAGPWTLNLVHNLFAFNGSDDATNQYQGNLRITPNDALDSRTIQINRYNNIFFKPTGHCNETTSRAVNTSHDITIDGDFNSWIEDDNTHTNAHFFARWSFFEAPTADYSYGLEGPGRGVGSDYFDHYYTSVTVPTNGTGHNGQEANSYATGGATTTEPSFANVVGRDFELTVSYPGTDISLKGFYTAAMGTDKAGNTRTVWDLGPLEFVPTPPSGSGGAGSTGAGGVTAQAIPIAGPTRRR